MLFESGSGQCEEAPGLFAQFITLGSMLLVLASLPFSLFFVVKVVQVKITQISDLQTEMDVFLRSLSRRTFLLGLKEIE